MGKDNGQAESKREILAFHAAILRSQREAGTLGELVSIKELQGLLAQCLGVMTRQTAADKTWAMEALGLIEVRKREGVIFLEAPLVVA